MEHPVTAGSGHRILELPASLDLNSAGPLVELLHKCHGDDVTLDGSKVQRLGGSCLQVLLAAQRTWSSEGAALTLENASERMVEDLRLLGIDPVTFLDGATPQ